MHYMHNAKNNDVPSQTLIVLIPLARQELCILQ